MRKIKTFGLIDPVDFPLTIEYRGHSIRYTDVMEVAQGSPEVGDLWIDDRKIEKLSFGGPLLCFENYVFLPALFRGLLETGFKICAINLETGRILIDNELQPLILIKEVANNTLFYFTDLQNTRLKTLDISLVVM